MMTMRPALLPAVLWLASAASLHAQASPRALQPDPPHECEACAEWNAPRAPFKVFGNTYFVGPAGLGSVLITGDAGFILLDGGLPQSAPLIDAHIRSLGLAPEKIRIILNSHAHYDHAGGIAALQRMTGATVMASVSGAWAIAHGEPTKDDPQFAFGRAANAYPAAKNVKSVADGEVVRLGNLAVTAHYTPGHTPGSTTWTWRSCEGDRCLDIVYADSLNAVSAPGFRFTGDASHESRIPLFERSIATVEALPCDIVIAVHPGFVDLDAKVAARGKTAGVDPLIDPKGCRAYAAGSRERLAQRVAEEKATAGTHANP
jgi:metallo-beta-lactamase class B